MLNQYPEPAGLEIITFEIDDRYFYITNYRFLCLDILSEPFFSITFELIDKK